MGERPIFFSEPRIAKGGVMFLRHLTSVLRGKTMLLDRSCSKVQLHEVSLWSQTTVWHRQQVKHVVKAAQSLVYVERGTFSTEARKPIEEIFQLTQCEEDVQPIHENDEDVSDIRVFTYNIDGEEDELSL